MKSLAHIAVAVLCLCSCTPENLTSVLIAKRCQEYHEREGHWYDKEVLLELVSQSVFSDNNTEIIQLRMDNKSDEFEYHNLFRGVHLEYRAGACTAHNDSSSCENYEWASKFYPYIWGIPSKFFDPGVQVQDAFEEEFINEKPVYVIHIAYENEDWDFYINRESYYLEGFKFVKKDDRGGEIVFNEGAKTVNGIVMPTKRIWYDLDMKLLGTDVLK
ncbi:MAG: DUF6503 family protein [Bacteroidota bacterium]